MEILVIDKDAETYAEGLRAEGARVLTAPSAAAVTERMLEAGGLVALAPPIPPDLPGRMPRLKWVHALTTGVDNLLAPGVLARDVALSRTRGVHGAQMSELAILMMLALARDLPGMLDDQRAGRWDRRMQPVLAGRSVCILGLGAIAEALAGRAAAFGMRVTGVSDGRAAAPGFAQVYPRARLAEAAGQADFLVVLVPLSESTRHIVDRAVLAAMKPGAFLVNIARGGCVDEAALLDALVSGRLAGAGMDGFETEPLPAQSPFRALPNVIVTPHVGGFSDRYAQDALPVVIDHYRAFVAGGAAALPDRVERE